MYEAIKNSINNTNFNLNTAIEKIDIFFWENKLTKKERDELIELARENAKTENSYASEQEQINNLFEELAELKARVDILEGKEIEETEEYPEFVQPSNSIDCYNIGDKITFKGKKYTCKMNSCIWSPEFYPQGWEEVLEAEDEVIENTEEV